MQGVGEAAYSIEASYHTVNPATKPVYSIEPSYHPINPATMRSTLPSHLPSPLSLYQRLGTACEV